MTNRNSNDLVNYLNSIDFSLVTDKTVLTNIYTEILPEISNLCKDPFASTSLEKLIGLSDSSNLLILLEKVNRNIIYKKLGSRILECVYKRLFDCLYKENDIFLIEKSIEFISISDCLDCHNAVFVLRQIFMLLSGKRIEKLEVIKYKVSYIHKCDGNQSNSNANKISRTQSDSNTNNNKTHSNSNIDKSERTQSDSNINNLDIAQVNSNTDSNKSQSNSNIDNNKTQVNSNTDNNFNHMINFNRKYSENKLNEIKSIFMKKIPSFDSIDQFNTFGVFLQITKSQSLLEFFLERDCCFENIIERGFLYELIPTVASTKNLTLIFNKIKNCLSDLALNEKSSYFMQSFLRNSCYCKEVFNSLDFEQFGPESNVILALLESLQQNSYKEVDQNIPDMIDQLIRNFYKFENSSIFKSFLLEKYGSLDSKCIKVVCNFMRLPSHTYRTNEDFLKFFEKSWIKSKSGIELIQAFAEGSCDRNRKVKFFNENIDLLWDCYKWKNSKEFIKRLCDLTTGHSRKKAFEISRKL